jgi:hypothetical protein
MKRELFETILKVGMAAAVFAIACPDLSWAQDLQGTVKAAKSGIKDMPTIVSGFAYIAGGAAMLSGAGFLKKHADNPQQNPIAPGIMRMALGGTVAAMPAFLGWVNDSLANSTADPLKYKGLDSLT